MTKLEPLRLEARRMDLDRPVQLQPGSPRSSGVLDLDDDNGDKKNLTRPPLARRPKKQCRFVESRNQYYRSADTHNEQERHSAQWYSPQDYQNFEKQTQKLANAFGATTRSGSSLSRSLVCLYFQLRTAQSTGREAALTLHAHSVGLQPHVWNCPIRADFCVRRKHLLEQLQRLGESPRDEWMRQTSLLTSQASVLYAQAVAQASWRSSS